MGLFDHLYNLDWTARYPLQYYYNDGRHVIFEKYEIDMFGNIFNKDTGLRLAYSKLGKYDVVGLHNSTGKSCGIRVARAVVSTFQGKPPTSNHSAEHIENDNKNNDIVCELTWMDPSGQSKNRVVPEKLLTAFIVVRNDLEMTNKEWVKYLEKETNSFGRKYTENMISQYVRKKQHGFSYKVYEDLPNEIWYKVVNSDNKMGHWQISDQNRVAYVTKFARNVIDSTRFGFDKKYPKININGKHRRLHDVAFEAYYPDLYTAKLPHEMILHKHDDKLDFRPHMLFIGDASKNHKDAHANGCHDGTKTARMPCFSYVNGVFEKRHDSQQDAAEYLRVNGYKNARRGNIGNVLKINKDIVRYGRTWKACFV